MHQLKIYEKAYDATLYIYAALRQFPKSEKFTLAADIRRTTYAIIGLIIRANRARSKWPILRELDEELEQLRLLLRLAKDLGFLPFKKYEVSAKRLDEIGRMLGGGRNTEVARPGS